MGKAILAMVAAAAIGTTLLMTDIAGARPDGVSGARGAGSGSGLRGSSVAGPRSGFGRRGGAVHGRGSALGRHAGHGRRHPGFRRPYWALGASGFDAGLPGYEYAPGLPPNCLVRRMQIDDDWGWRVRDMVVCPPSGLFSAGSVQ
jgi:hypothetical protein